MAAGEEEISSAALAAALGIDPVLARKDIAMMGIPGRPPALKNPPPGCRFAPRCLKATDKCRQDPAPEFREIRPGRFAACHYLESEVN